MQKFAKKDRNVLEKRINDILSELKTLDKGVQSGKFGLGPQDVTDYVLRFLSMSAALNEAARTQDRKEVERQSLRMSELKKELAVATATSKSGRKDAQKKLDERAKGNLEINAYVEARDTALERVGGLRVHVCAEAVDADLGTIERDLIATAARPADADDYPAAMLLLNKVEGACATAESVADACEHYRALLFRLQSQLAAWRMHQQAEAGEAEFLQVDQKIVAAAAAADVKTRDYPAAEQRLGEGHTLGEAGEAIADKAQTFHDARETTTDAMVKLAQHTQAAAIEPERDELDKLLVAADALAELAQRKYDDAVNTLRRIDQGVVDATGLADRCQGYVDDLARVQTFIEQCGHHAQADAVEQELKEAAEKIDDAARLAAPGSRDYPAALFSLQQAYESGENAQRIAAECQTAMDAGNRSGAALQGLAAYRKRYESVAKQLELLEAKQMQADEKASKKQRDYKGALDLYNQIEPVAVKAKAAADKTTWKDSLLDATRELLDALKVNSAERTRLEALWGIAHEQAQDKRHGDALKTLTTLRELAVEALKAKPDQTVQTEKGDSVEKRTATVEAEMKITVLLQQVQAFLAQDLQAATELAKTVGNNPPPAWKLETDRIALTLSLGREAGAVAIETALDQARKDLEKHLTAVNKVLEERKTWIERWGVYDTQYQSLTRHGGFTGQQPLIDRRTSNHAAALLARTTSQAHTYPAAVQALAPCITEVEALRKLADAATAYTARRAIRRAELTTTPRCAEQQATVARAVADLCLVDAASLATQGKFDEAIAEMEKMPALCETIRMAKQAKRNYVDYVNTVVNPKFNVWGALDEKYKKHLATELDPMRKIIAKAKAARDTDKNIIKAGNMIEGLDDLVDAYEAMEPAVKDYVDKRALFDAEYKKVDEHAGREGIEPFYERVKADNDFADASALKREFKAATKLLEAWMPQFPLQLQVAARYETYKTKKESVEKKIEEIGKLPGIDQAAGELANSARYTALAAQLAAAATAQADKAQLDAATTALDQALAAAEAAKTVLEKNEALKDLKDQGGGSGTDLESLKARVAAFPAKRDLVRQTAGDDTFATLLGQAANQAQQADTALKLETPDTGTASGQLDQAEQTIDQTLPKALRKGPYTTLHNTVSPLIKTTLPPLNVDPNKCLDTELQKLTQLLTEAENLARDPTFDFAQALAKLTEAQVLAGRAQDKLKEFKALAADRLVIKNLITALDTVTHRTVLAKEIARLRDVQTKTDEKLAAFDFAAARKLVADGKALKAPYEKLMTDYNAVNGKRTTRYAAADLLLVGKPEVQREHDEYQKHKLQIDKMIDTDHAFIAASKLLDRIRQIEIAAADEIAHYKTYADARKLITDRVPGAKTDSNDAVAAMLKQVDDELARAEKEAAKRQLVQAKSIVDALKPVLDQVDIDKPLFAAYATSRDLVLQRLQLLSKHAKVDFATPLAAMADGKRLESLKALDRRDFTAAKKLADEAADGLQVALNAADGYAEFDALGGGTDEGNLKALSDAADRVDAKLEELTDGVPAAEQLPGAIGRAREAVKAAREALVGKEAPKAAEQIKLAGAACAQGEAHKLQCVQIRQQQTAAKLLVNTFTGGGHAQKNYVATRMADTLKDIEGATQAMISRGAEAAAKVLIAATDKYHKDVRVADGRKAYVTLRETLEPQGAQSELDKFERHARRHAAAADIEVLRVQLAKAAAAADAPEPDFAEAMRCLKEADEAAAAARLALAVLDTAAPPSPADIAKVLTSPKGIEKIDAMVKNLNPKERRRVLHAAFKERFGCELTVYVGTAANDDPDKFGLDVARFYENFAKLPPKHTLKNDMLLKLNEVRDVDDETEGHGGASSFGAAKRTVTMRDGSAATGSGRHLGAKHALGDVEDAYKPADDTPPVFVDWNTVHEAGHAVETANAFMKTHAGDDAYGGWIEYGMDTDRVAAELEIEFDYDRTYIAELLAGNADPAIPDPKNGVSHDEWERRRQRVRLWNENAQAGKNPWESNATALRLKLKNGLIIHQAYAYGRWFGYKASARAKGITGYQFRSPVEWFSELYAAYYLKKLKPDHPAGVWLAKLAAPDDA
jgi:hypothetical protein